MKKQDQGLDWIPCAVELPQNGEVVMTKIDGSRGVSNIQELRRRGRLWWMTDDVTYVSYTPTHWSPLLVPPRIVRRKGVCGGDPCVRGTRVAVWFLQHKRSIGRTIAQIIASFPFLSKEDVHAAFDYADSHAEEIEQQIRENTEPESAIDNPPANPV